MSGFTNYIGERGVAASPKIISLVLFSEQNFGQRMDFGNFGRYAGRKWILGGPRCRGKILRKAAKEEGSPPKKTLFPERVNKATELKALSYYCDPFKDMEHGPESGVFHANVTCGCVLFHAPRGRCGIAPIRSFGFGCTIKLYH
jgi:hypothetical protein